jgi:hypothetical protein
MLQPATPERYEAMPCPTEAMEGALPELTCLCEEDLFLVENVWSVRTSFGSGASLGKLLLILVY